ncbi:MAG: tetraacyldisaccharide 4'-kinase [Bacteroidota bacterium]
MIKYLRLFLLPFSILYGIVVLVRNKLYDAGIFKSTSFSIPVICVGNLVVGGSGKTPVTEYLVQLFNGKRIAILSRGYGRKTNGYILADQHATAETIGDEPMQFYQKFPQVTVAVCEDRVKGIRLLEAAHDLIILDDAYQHRSVRPGFSILLFEYQKLLSQQFLLPAGNLREPFKGYKRADSLLVTKAPEQLDPVKKEQCAERFEVKSRESLAFSSLTYGRLTGLFSKEELPVDQIDPSTHIYLLTGIANPEPLVSYLKQYTSHVQHFDHPDHYSFKLADIHKLVNAFTQNAAADKLIITTEKDAQRLNSESLRELLLNLPLFYLPVKIALSGKDKATFDQKILDYVSGTTGNR